MERKTPLYEKHVQLGGKIVPFAGYLLPVQYKTGVIAEHMAVRKACGLFDVSHMGEVVVTGEGAFDFVQKLVCNDMTGLENGRVRYSPMLNEAGGVVDDLLVCRLAENSFYIVVNAANREKDVAWMRAHIAGNANMEDISDSVAQVALQGPFARKVMDKLCKKDDIPKKYYSFVARGHVADIECLISRTGYTGERGYEIYCKNADAEKLWDILLEAGAEFGLIPCGLGARDTLRLEAAMPLYGHEMDDEISPLETSLDMFVKLDKPDFIGKSALIARGEAKKTRVGLFMVDRGIAREHCDVYKDGALVGHTTSGTHCPFIGRAAAMAIIDKRFAAPGETLEVDVRGKKLKCEVTGLPFYKLEK